MTTGLQEANIQKVHGTPPEQLTDKELLLSTILQKTLPGDTLFRVHVLGFRVGWDKEQRSIFSSAPKHTGSGYLQSSAT